MEQPPTDQSTSPEHPAAFVALGQAGAAHLVATTTLLCLIEMGVIPRDLAAQTLDAGLLGLEKTRAVVPAVAVDEARFLLEDLLRRIRPTPAAEPHAAPSQPFR